MTRALAAVADGIVAAVALTLIAAAGFATGWLFCEYVIVPFWDPHHMAHWPVVGTVAALVLTVLMALTSHHRSTR